MQKVGKLVTCDRCGRTLFLEDEVPMYAAKDIGEEVKYGPNNEEWKTWGLTYDNKDLCPECAAHYERMMFYFWNNKKVDPVEDVHEIRYYNEGERLIDNINVEVTPLYFNSTYEELMEGAKCVLAEENKE